MNPLVVSPHLDDAVLGLGAYLAASQRPVLSIFAGMPSAGVSAYDKACGFESSEEAMRARHAEDAAALAILGCERRTLPFLDSQYGGARPTPHALAERIDSVRQSQTCDSILAPLGIQHPDHVVTSDACTLLAGDGTAVWLYEELPYRVAYPELAWLRLEELRLRVGLLLTLEAPEQSGPLEAKEQAVECYRSQHFDMHAVLCPERLWRVWR